MDCRRMVVEAQIMVDAAKSKQKGKSVEIEGRSEDDQTKQMDIWEDSVSIALFTSGHLEVKLDNTANMARAKKRIMKYHWYGVPKYVLTDNGSEEFAEICQNYGITHQFTALA
ncbi:unnamed protein product [Sphagnum compactum]